jgi:hypothetical protein
MVCEAKAEKSLDVHVVRVVVDPAPAHGFGDPQRVATDDSHGHTVDHVVDITDHGGRRGVERRFELALLR